MPSVEAFDDAEVALEAVGEFGQRLLVGRALACGDRLLEAVELDQDDAFRDPDLVPGGPAADAGEHSPARGLELHGSGGPLTFRQLRSACGNVSSSVLTRRLSELADVRLVEHRGDGDALTRLAEEFVESMQPLQAWSLTWAAQLEGREQPRT